MIRKIYAVTIGIFIFSASMAQTAVSDDDPAMTAYQATARSYVEAHHLKGFFKDLITSAVTDKSKLVDFKKYIAVKKEHDSRDFIIKVGENKLATTAELDNYIKLKKAEYVASYADFISRSKSLATNPTPFAAGQPCQNMDFESQTFTGWVASYGSCSDPTLIAGFNTLGINASTGQHTIMTSGTDPNVPAIPCVMPGGSASMRLGDNNNGGREGARISQTFLVSGANPYFSYNYAVVLEDAGHPVAQQPYFRIRMYDGSNNLIDCATLNIDATNAPGLNSTATLKYKNWTSVLIPLAPYVGQNVTIEFTTGDCDALGGTHDGYAYIDGSCTYTPAIIPSAPLLCLGQTMTLTGPPGLGSYTWSGPGIVSGGSSQVVTVNAGGTYTVSLTTQTTPPNIPCNFSLSYTVPTASSAAQFTSNTVCAGSPTQLTDGSAPAGSVGNWQWDFDNNGSIDATSQNPTYTFPAAGTFPVTLTITAGSCTSTITNNVTVTSSGSPNITSVAPVCSNASPFALSASLGGGTWSGTGITDAAAGTFDPAGASTSGANVITYTVTGACAGSDTVQINVIPSSTANWTPTTLCAMDAPVNLNTFVSGTAGGTWSGTGVTGSTFDPAGLSGPISVTYTVGSSPCVATSTQSMTVTPVTPPSVTSVAPVCSNAAAFGLTADQSGGTWSGTGITDTTAGTFNPASATAGTNVITYTVPGTCAGSDTIHISVIPSSTANWTTTAMCALDAPINLNTLVTGTAGGTWSGTGVTGNTFDPAGLSGAISVTYTVGTSPCVATSTQSITVNPNMAPSVTSVAPVCSNASAFTLSASLTGGTWTGTGVTDATLGTFTPGSATIGNNVITYTISGACGSSDTIQITVVPSSNPAWTSTALCSAAAPVNLNTLVTGTNGGTWSGTGVTGSTFNPAGLSGPISVTYTVGASPCVGTQTHTISVTPNANATVTAVSPLCADAPSISLTTAGTGGVWSGAGVSSTGVFNPAAAGSGTHPVTYSIAGACGDTSTINITVIPTGTATWTLPAAICAGDAPVNLNSLITGTPGGTFTGTGVTGGIFDPSGLSGTVNITYTVGTSPCQHSMTLPINVDAIDAAFTATPTTGQAPLTVDFTNGSTNAVSYNWTFGNGSSSAATDPNTVYPNYGNYTATLVATNATGCSDTTRIVIHVDGISILTVPNVFTPNGDGHNDTFEAIMAEGLSSFEAVVYDRWGLKMYDWTNSNTGWNGKAKNGSDAPDGTYYYIIKGKGIDGKDYNFTGFVSLIRN
ncbi:MAG: hypothetical protein JWP12_3743 [Bacteroidetes bacterium]|nr:hypothetical protein [Bacteroidota bacterium]